MFLRYVRTNDFLLHDGIVFFIIRTVTINSSDIRGRGALVF